MSEFHYVRTTGVDGGVDAVNGPAIGIDLESMLQDGLPPFKVVLEIVAAMCEILDIADQDGEVHGDLAPDWIFVDDTGAVSIEGFGVKRDESMAPEGRPTGTATDLYGLGYIVYRLFSPEDLDEVDLDEPDAHDDGIIDCILGINLDGLPEEIVGDVQWYIAKLMSFELDDRPNALETWRSFIAFADMADGDSLEEWAPDAVQGEGDRRNADEAGRGMEAPDAEAEADDDEDLGGPVLSKGPLARGGISFGGGAKPGQATAFWSKEQMKAALETEEEEEEYRPATGGGAATAFWSKDQMEAMQRGDTEAPRPKRGGGQAQKRATMMVARSDMERAETAQKRQQQHAKVSTPEAAPPPVAAAPPPVAAAPPPVAKQVSAAPPPVITATHQAPAWDQDDEDEGGGKTKLIAIGVGVVLLLLVCGGIAVIAGGGAFFMSGDGDNSSADVEDTDEPKAEDEPKEQKDTAEPKEEPEPEPKAQPKTQPKSQPKATTTPTTPSTSTGGSVRPRTRPAPVAPAGPVKGTVKTTERAQLRCSDGQQVDVDGSRTLEFEAFAIPVTCMVIINGKMGAVQFERTTSVSCAVAGDEVACH